MYPYMDGVFAYFKPFLPAFLQGAIGRIQTFPLAGVFLGAHK